VPRLTRNNPALFFPATAFFVDFEGENMFIEHAFDYKAIRYPLSSFYQIVRLTKGKRRKPLSDEKIGREVAAESIPIFAIRRDLMATGTVKWFNPTKGFGFIEPSDGGSDVFVHISAVEQAGLRGLNEGQKIEYEVKEERGKQAACNLKEVA